MMLGKSIEREVRVNLRFPGSDTAMTRYYYDPDAKPGTYVPPENKACRIWRYMDFARYVSMLLSKGLYFARIDQLGDPFEGASPASFLGNYLKVFEGRLVDGKLPPGLAEDRGRVRLNTAVNCWHMNEHESLAMWKLYSADNKGVAIQTTCADLEQSLPRLDSISNVLSEDKTEPIQLRIGQVKYIDYDTDEVKGLNTHVLAILKRKSFSFEQELRVIISRFMTVPIVVGGPPVSVFPHGGVTVPVDLQQLVTQIVVSPMTPPWMAELVETVTKSLGYSFPVRRSTLDNLPTY